MKYHAAQFLFRLTQTVTIERAHSLVCLPDRTTAQDQLDKIQRQYGANLLRSVIRKDHPSSRRTSAKAEGKRCTYTLRYFTRETVTNTLF